MTHDDIIAYGLQKRGVSLRHPFDPLLPVLFVGSKIFALLGSHTGSPSVNLKADPEDAWLQRQTYPGAVTPGYHMNKRHWNTVHLNGAVPDDELRTMIDESYLLAARSLRKDDREALGLPPRHGRTEPAR
ncbi:MmcQ/YjbR family DNA-binding protein [Paenibacillus koleovorans]|uniref:MmcQ/YjbR family DNA-binding protein n=1 Tax=Paenibacillus koleovorans TaxID=121608 RepID=UPI000FD8E4CF|nr:MmcQ/YjbR family DNA-binding protein [Paenibacillus koleovorans]